VSVVEVHAVAPVELARELIVGHGWNATCYQILNPGMRHWFSPARDAVAGYTRRGNVLLAAGAPVCRQDLLEEVCGQFEAFARDQGCRVCYVCAEERLRRLFADSPRHAAIALGAQPAWSPAGWPEIVRNRSSIRAQLHRAFNKSVEAVEVEPEDAAADPDLRRVLDEWVRSRRLPPLHFLVEPDVLDGVLADRIVLVARRGGTAVAFLVASPVAARKGYLVELLARSVDAPNGTSEVLIDAAMRRFARDGCAYVTLGLVALSHAADEQIRANPRWAQMLMYFARAHANRFYNFRGLEHFRVKMAPERWEPVYAISNEPRFTLSTLYAMGSAFSGMPPWAAIAIGLAKAAGDECGSAAGYLRRLWRANPPAARAPRL
jgi:phosphatidylglycerol lysyltransferase